MREVEYMRQLRIFAKVSVVVVAALVCVDSPAQGLTETDVSDVIDKPIPWTPSDK